MTPGTTPFRRIDPRPGMMIDADLWREAHDYHREQLNLHHLALHGWGVIQGLEIGLVEGEGKDNTVRIGAGIAIDSAGRFVLVPQSQTYELTTREHRTVYLVLQFRDVQPEASAGKPWRLIEAYRIQERDRLPEEPYIELARVDFDPGAGKLKTPRDADNPGKNELDLRARSQLGSATTPIVRPVPQVQVVGGAEDLVPRVDDLAERVGALSDQTQELVALKDQVQALTRDVDALLQQPPPALATPMPDGEGQHDHRVDSLAAQLQHLAARLDTLSTETEPARPVVVAGPGPRPPGVTADQVSTTVAEHVGAVTQQIDSVAQRVDDLSQHVDSVDQRAGHELDALSLQIQALLRQVDTLAVAPPPAAALVSVPVPTTVAVSADRQKVHVALAETGVAGWDVHREGLRLLAREIGSQTTTFEGVALDNVRMSDAYGLQLLYLSGHAALSLGDADVDAIRRLLDEGTSVVGEGCASGPGGETGAREFAMSFVELANRLGRQLTRVDRVHPLMRARNVFGELPSGGRPTARVLEAGGLVYSDTDYGCAWQGGPADKALPRSTIRDAFDLGVNLALFRLH